LVETLWEVIQDYIGKKPVMMNRGRPYDGSEYDGYDGRG
jgi:hypothetical protein